MLPPRARLRTAAEFTRVVRAGGRAGRGQLVVHARLGGEPGAARFGFVVGRAVGPAVVRNRVRRRLRHLALPRVAGLPTGAEIVVRALPGAAGASSAELATELDAALPTALRRATERRSVGSVSTPPPVRGRR